MKRPKGRSKCLAWCGAMAPWGAGFNSGTTSLAGRWEFAYWDYCLAKEKAKQTWCSEKCRTAKYRPLPKPINKARARRLNRGGR